MRLWLSPLGYCLLGLCGCPAPTTEAPPPPRNAVVVPAAAIVPTPDGGMAVMVVGRDGRAHQHDVQVGGEQGEMAQIVPGVRAGDMVVTPGAYGLPDNTQVKVAKSEPQPPGEKAAAVGVAARGAVVN